MEAEAKSKLRGSQANTMNFQGEKIFNIHLKEFNIGYSWIIIPNPTHRVWTGTNSFKYQFTLPYSGLECGPGVIRLGAEM